MPISRLQFEMGIDEGIEALMVSVYDLLEVNHDAAYSEEELYRLFTANAPGSYIDNSHLDIALQKVVELACVEARSVANATYYAFLCEVDKETWVLVTDEADEADEAEADAPDDEEAALDGEEAAPDDEEAALDGEEAAPDEQPPVEEQSEPEAPTSA